MRLRPRSYTLFPYTTLFRSARSWIVGGARPVGVAGWRAARRPLPEADRAALARSASGSGRRAARQPARSEEHTSELQSRRDLVCRLLLEKKKTHKHVLVRHC